MALSVTPDMRAAIAEGALPGALSADRTAFVFPRLEYVGGRGATLLWTVRVRLLGPDGGLLLLTDALLGGAAPPPGARGEITVESRQRGGADRTDKVPTYVSAGKNLGRKNATTPLTQALRDALGLFNKQRKRAGVVAERPGDTPDDGGAAPGAAGAAGAGAGAAAAPGGAPFDERPLPMLVKKLGATKDAALGAPDFREGVTVQRKLNGVHLVFYVAPDGAPTLYSRQGTLYLGQAHIAAAAARLVGRLPEALAALAARGGPPAAATEGPVYLAGELYRHGQSLNWISGQARRADDEGTLQFHVFDAFFPRAIHGGHDLPSRGRQAVLDALFAADAAAGPGGAGGAGGAGGPGVLRGAAADAPALAAPAPAAPAPAPAAPAAPAPAPAAPRALRPAPPRPAPLRPAPPRAAPPRPAPGGAGLPPAPPLVRVENHRARSMEEVEALTKRFISEGYEGAIARKDSAGYRYSYSGYHSSGLLKIKPLYDSEFPVVGFTQGTSGKDVGALVWVCEVPEAEALDPSDRAFSVVPKNMTYAERYALFRCLGARGPDGRTRFERALKGLPLTVEYPELSAKTGKPVQAKATVFRTYEGEGGAAGDPVRRLLAECAAGGAAGGAAADDDSADDDDGGADD